MAKRDVYHEQVKHALIKDGWTITHDPFTLEIGDRRLEADLAAERLISAEKGVRRIVVEVKSFLGRSAVNELEQALGQYMLYHRIMECQHIDHELYLAIPNRAFETVFTINPLVAAVFARVGVR